MTPEEMADRLHSWFQGSHYVNVLVRRGGQDEIYEADFLREIVPILKRTQ